MKSLHASTRCYGLILILLAVWLGGCTPSTVPVEGAVSESEQPPGADPFPPSAYEGRLEPFAYGLGDYTEALIEELGEPQAMDFFAGGLYFSYADVVYFTDAELSEGDEINHGSVKRIGMRPGTGLFGVTVGDPLPELAGVLGAGSLHSPEDNVNDGYYEGQWTLHYALGDYELVFTAESEDGPSIAAYYEERA
ncbi:hypothetical protein [Paenibacillus sp. 1P07SE]|uniref:hypothetical protein n=1 Tax=Paenibacillus sp. 1P07SE TaxID=3132209 RepID=UPI0039A77B65